jgi:HEPN domain-containing protein
MGNNELYDWLYLADADIDSALFLKSGRPQHKEIICFHCQQSAEKYLKAFLVSCQTEPSKTHDLRVLCELCQVQDNSFAELNLMCSYLNPFGVQPRYPHELDITEQTIEKVILYAQTIREFPAIKLLRDKYNFD